MSRVILALFLFAVLALAVVAGLALARALRAQPSPSREVAMPGAVSGKWRPSAVMPSPFAAMRMMLSGS